MNKLEAIIEQLEESFDDADTLLKADGFDNAVIGLDRGSMRLIYSVSKCLKILVKDQGMSREEAQEYFDFNVAGAYVGEQTPIWCDDTF